MKRILFLLFIPATFTMNVWAQAGLSSNKEMHTLGQIAWKKPVTVEYVITNTGNAPLVLSNITTSCACAVAEWTKDSIPPGEKGIVKATFDAKALGYFHKSIGIYSNAPTEMVYLYFTGEVVPNPVAGLSEIPVQVTPLPDLSDMNAKNKVNAPIVLSETTVDLRKKLQKKNKVTHDITITNRGETVLEINSLQVLNPAICVNLKKKTLRPGEKTRLRITVDKQLLTPGSDAEILLTTNEPKNQKVSIELRFDDQSSNRN